MREARRELVPGTCLLILIIGVAGAGCRTAGTTSAQQASPAPTWVVAMERTECFGFCPVFRVEIFESGDVVFRGDENVREKGLRRGHLMGTTARELVAAFESARFFELKDQYTGVNDAPATILAVRDGTRTKQVVFQQDSTGLPGTLVELEARVDRALDLDQWVGPKSSPTR